MTCQALLGHIQQETRQMWASWEKITYLYFELSVSQSSITHTISLL